MGFRWYVQQQAGRLGIRGYTRNLEDGRVEVFATGTRQKINQLASQLRLGPQMADVSGFEEQEAAPESVSGFRIER